MFWESCPFKRPAYNVGFYYFLPTMQRLKTRQGCCERIPIFNHLGQQPVLKCVCVCVCVVLVCVCVCVITVKESQLFAVLKLTAVKTVCLCNTSVSYTLCVWLQKIICYGGYYCYCLCVLNNIGSINHTHTHTHTHTLSLSLSHVCVCVSEPKSNFLDIFESAAVLKPFFRNWSVHENHPIKPLAMIVQCSCRCLVGLHMQGLFGVPAQEFFNIRALIHKAFGCLMFIMSREVV